MTRFRIGGHEWSLCVASGPAAALGRAIIAGVYESYSQPIISRRAYAGRQVRHVVLALLVLGGSLVVGVIGYMSLHELTLVDAFVNAAMILGGMGPVDQLKNEGAKWFAGIYALYSGIVFLVAVAVVAAPAVHRFLHRLNLDEDRTEDS